MAFLGDFSEERLGQRVVASHAVEQPRRSKLGAHPGSDIRHQNREVQQLEQEEAARLPRHQGKCRLHLVFWKRFGAPYQLRRIHFERRKHARHHAHQHRRQQNVFFGIFHFFRKRRNRVEPYIGQHRNRCAVKDQIQIERCRIVKRLAKKSRTVGMQLNQKPHHIREKNDHHDGHRSGQHVVDSRGRLYAPQIQNGERCGVKRR